MLLKLGPGIETSKILYSAVKKIVDHRHIPLRTNSDRTIMFVFKKVWAYDAMR